MLSKSILSANRLIINQRAAAFSSWAHLTPAPADPILGLNEAFKNEKNPKKVLLGMGAYRTDQGKPFILPCVKLAEEKMLADNMDHEYAGIQGIDAFVANALKIAYGEDSAVLKEGRVAGA